MTIYWRVTGSANGILNRPQMVYYIGREWYTTIIGTGTVSGWEVNDG